MFSFFINLREQNSEEEIFQYLESYEITKLDINRIYRYIDKHNLSNIDNEIDNEIISVDIE